MAAPDITPTLGQAAPRLQSVAAIVNPAAGGVRGGVEAELAALVAEFGYPFRPYTVQAGNLEAIVREAAAGSPDLIVVLAGDGTARLTAEVCGPDGPLVAPLPGGTLNMLPHAIYGAARWQDALRGALDAGVPRTISGGRIAGHTFFVATILGSPALWGQAREAFRAGRLVETGRRIDLAIRRAFTGRVRYGADRELGHSEALALICPLVSKALAQECALELVGLDFRNAREMVRLAFKGVTGGWRDDASVSIELVQHGWARMRGSIPAILDGETHKLPRRAEFEFVPRAFRALAPAEPAASHP